MEEVREGFGRGSGDVWRGSERFGIGRKRNGLVIREEKGQIRERAYGKKEK